MMTREALDILGVKFPIFQAPIGSIASPELAAAVSNAGDIGHLACTWRTPEQLTELFRAMRKLTSLPYGANFVLDFPIEDRLAVALEERVPVISFFWGDASRYVGRVHDAGALAIQVVGSIRDIAASALGAAGVWVGTRFLSASEANIHDVYRDRVLASSGDDVVYSELFNVGWPNAPLHSLANSTIERWRAAGLPASPNRPGENEIVARRGDGSQVPRYHFGSPTRDVSGQVEAMALYAGEAVGLVRRSQSAASIVGELAEAFRDADAVKDRIVTRDSRSLSSSPS